MHVPPPRPRLTLRVGITGHRALADASLPALRERVRAMLEALRATATAIHARPGHDFADAPPALVLVSSLASGSDCLVAAEAVAQGWTLQAPLPFARDEYRRDFAGDADRATFDRLLAAAEAVLELDGTRDDEVGAYLRASTVMLEQSDVLLAIWDGARSPHAGGTAHTVRQAVALEVPVLWIDAVAPHAVRAVGEGAQATEAADLRAAAADAVARQFPPIADPDDPLRAAYFTEPARDGAGPGVFRRFRALVELGGHGHAHGQGAAGDAADAARALAAMPPALRSEHDRADALAGRYAARYRDAFTANYLMGAGAVAAALVGFVSPVGTVVELLLIAGILVVTHRGRRGMWHERWLGYRLCAEQLRHLALLRPLGRTLPTFRVPAHAAASDPSRLWTSWLARARTREAGMARGAITAATLRDHRAALRATVRGQVAYHEQAAHRGHHLAHRLHAIGTALFYVTLLVCVAHLVLEVSHHLHHAPPSTGGPAVISANGLLTFLAAVLPAFGAALAGIASQGEFDRVAQRSRAMAQQLGALLPRLDAADDSDACAAAAAQGVEIMTAELLDWQATFRAKPIVLPA